VLLSITRFAPPADAWAALSANWRWMLNEQIHALPYSKVWLGTDQPGRNFDRILFSTFAYCALLGGAAFICAAVRKSAEARVVTPVATMVVVLGILFAAYDIINWQYDPFAALTLAILALAIGLMTILVQRSRDRIDHILILRLTIVWFALFLLVQLGLRAVI